MRIPRPGLFVLACALLTASSAAAAASPFSDALVQAPEIAAPQRGSVVGQLASTVFGPADVERGAFALPAPFAAADARGALLASPFPVYAPDAPLSEWGLGFRASLALERARMVGELDFATDDLVGPWGRMTRGEGGAYYAQGLSPAVRVEEGAGSTLVAYLPNGTTWTFGGAERLDGPRGSFAYYVTSVVAPTGHTTRFAYDANASGRRFLREVTYGGLPSAPEYRIAIEYVSSDAPVVDYRAGREVVLDRRVQTVRMLVHDEAQHAFAERYRYELTHTLDATGVGFFLTSIVKRYASGEAEPPTTYTYDLAEAHLGQATAVRAPAVSDLARSLHAQFFQPARGTAVDLDEDGRPDVELADDGSALLQRDVGFERVALPPAPPGASSRCRPSPSPMNPPRTLARAKDADADPVVWSLQPSPTTTALTLCSRAGEIVYQASLPPGWALGPNTKLADLDRDRAPDLVRLGAGAYVALHNVSTAAGYAFGTEVRGALSPAFTPSGTWVQDMNGDGVADLVARSDSELTVWYGRGGLSFEPTGTTLRVFDGDVRVTGLADYTLAFTDANKDGLADVLLSKSNRYYLFTNRGVSLRRVAVPAISRLPAFAGQPVPIDLIGSGDTELLYSDGTDVLSVALDAPSTSLLTRADDGKGASLAFVYGRAPAAPGLRARPPVLTQLHRVAVGEELETLEYDYAEPRTHSVGRFLVGFDRVTRRGPTETETLGFLNDDRNAGLLLSSRTSDAKIPTVERVAFRAYEENTSFGIPWRRLRSEGRGFSSTNPLAPRTWLEETTFGTYDHEVCPAVATTTSEHGTLVTTTSYATIPAFDKHLVCFSSHVGLVGRHADQALDFSHALRIDRDARGLVVARTLEGAAGDLVEERVTYTDDGLVTAVERPGQGTTRVGYDPALRTVVSTTMPDGASTTVATRDPRTDAPLEVRIQRGGIAYTQHTTLDGLERVATSWTDLGAASAATPNVRLAYRFADTTSARLGLVHADALVRSDVGQTPVWSQGAELTTGAGGLLASVARQNEGWAFARLARPLRTQNKVESLLRPPLAGNIDDATASTLFAGADRVGSQVTSAFGVASETKALFHANVERTVTAALGGQSDLVLAMVENGSFTTEKALDSAMRTRRVKDPSGAAWTFRYDALGRVREATLPTGERHTVTFDAYGRASVLTRTGVARIELAYDPVSGLSVAMRFYADAPGATLLRTVSLVHDPLGRVRDEEHVDASGAKESLHYFYDGATPSEPQRRDALGLLTAVTGPGFSKRFEWRADAVVRRSTLAIDGFGEIAWNFAYDEDASLRSTTTRVRDSAGREISNVAIARRLDPFGRATGLTLDDKPLVSYGFDREGLLDFATFGTAAAPQEVITFQHDPTTRRHVGVNVNAGNVTGATSTTFDARGLVARETLAVGAATRSRVYAYTDAAYLASSTDGAETFRYAYDASGLSSEITEGGTRQPVVRAGNVITAGTHHHVLDALGRVVERDGAALAYGPRGQIQEVSAHGQRYSFLYDEAGRRIAKLHGGVVVAVYPKDGSYLDGVHGLIEPMTIGGRVVGLVRHGFAPSGEKSSFEAIVTDARGTRLSTTGGAASFASPYGARAAHPELAAAIDFAEKGWDEDLGVVRIGVRDYDPNLGRFLQPDPLYLEHPERCVDGWIDCNLYSYARNNPLGLADPSGMDPEGASVWARVGQMAAGVAYGTVQAFAPGGFLLNPPGQTKEFEAGKAAGQIVTGGLLAIGATLGEGASAAEGVATAPTLVGPAIGAAGVVACEAARVKGVLAVAAGVSTLMQIAGKSGVGGGAGEPTVGRIPQRERPRIEEGNLKEGWKHIDSRHVTGDHPQGPGDLFAPGTTRAQIDNAAREIVENGTRVSDPSLRIQTFEDKIKVNGQLDRVRVVVDSDDGNRVITAFPVRSE